MTATAQQRESALRPRLDRARTEVAELQAALADATERARAGYIGGNHEDADTAQTETVKLQAELATATTRLTTLEDAAQDLARQRAAEQLEAELGRVLEALAEAIAEGRRAAAQVRPALSAAKMSLQQAKGHQDLARSLELERYQLECALGRREPVMKFRANTNFADAMIESQPHLANLLRDPEI